MTLRAIAGSLLLLAAAPLHAQEHGSVRLYELVHGLTVTPRVLIIGAGPGDADADLIAWLARGRSVQTGYLALTRGESRPNFTGAESGPSLGAVHVEEMLAARRHDGGEQYFTRAFDFGSARNPAEVFTQWDHRTLLGDLVRIVRSFRPHVIIAHVARDTSAGGAVWQHCHTDPPNTPADAGCIAAAAANREGQQQASAQLAREVYDDAADTTRFPTRGYGPAWSARAFYEPGADVIIDAREFNPLRGTSYAHDAIDSRSQLRSLGFDAPDAFRIDPGLAGQRARLLEFVRKGGTLVVMSNQQAATQSGILPFPLVFATPVAERVTRANAPVTALDARARLLTWPNVIRPPDWSEWSGARALSVPTTADSRYATVVEMHDAGEKENRNTILVATVGKGRVIYTTLTLTQQIANGVAGAMRLFVNLLSAGLAP